MFVTNDCQSSGKIDTYLDRLQDLWGEVCIEEVWGLNELEENCVDNYRKNINSTNYLNLVTNKNYSNCEIAA